MYSERQSAHMDNINAVQDKMKQLESVEQYLVDQLGKTQNT